MAFFNGFDTLFGPSNPLKKAPGQAETSEFLSISHSVSVVSLTIPVYARTYVGMSKFSTLLGCNHLILHQPAYCVHQYWCVSCEISSDYNLAYMHAYLPLTASNKSLFNKNFAVKNCPTFKHVRMSHFYYIS